MWTSSSITLPARFCGPQVTEESCRAQFLVPVTAQGQNRAQASLERGQNLNPMVKVHADQDRVEDKPDDFFLQFDAVSGNDSSLIQQPTINSDQNKSLFKCVSSYVWDFKKRCEDEWYDLKIVQTSSSSLFRLRGQNAWITWSGAELLPAAELYLQTER